MFACISVPSAQRAPPDTMPVPPRKSHASLTVRQPYIVKTLGYTSLSSVIETGSYELMLILEHCKCDLAQLMRHDRQCGVVTVFCSNEDEDDWEQRRRLAWNISSALEYIHSAHGFCHLDLKPQNVLIQEICSSTPSLIAKLADFGAQFEDTQRKLAAELLDESREAFMSWPPDLPEVKALHQQQLIETEQMPSPCHRTQSQWQLREQHDILKMTAHLSA
eukprot:COSAG01_NODE_9894_length_2309_cov_1.641629_1_plen_219_part_10